MLRTKAATALEGLKWCQTRRGALGVDRLWQYGVYIQCLSSLNGLLKCNALYELGCQKMRRFSDRSVVLAKM